LPLIVDVLRAFVEVDAVRDFHLTAAAGNDAEAKPPDMIRRRLEQCRRGGERRAALPQLGDSRVAGGRQAARPEIGADEERVVIDPGGAGLRLRHCESVGNESLRRHIELALFGRLRARGPPGDDAAAVLRFEATRATPSPRHALRLAQRIEVDHSFPYRTRSAIARPRRPPPNAALVV